MWHIEPKPTFCKLCEIIDSSIIDEINIEELRKYLRAFTDLDSNTIFTHQLLASKIINFEFLQKLDYASLLDLFDKIEPFVKIKHHQDLSSWKDFYEELSVIISKEDAIDRRSVRFIDDFIQGDLTTIDILTKYSKKDTELLAELSEVLTCTPPGSGRNYEHYHVEESAPINVNELRFKILKIMLKHVLSSRTLRVSSGFNCDVEDYRKHWSIIVNNFTYCLPVNTNIDLKIYENDPDYPDWVKQEVCNLFSDKNLIDYIVNELEGSDFVPSVLAYQIIASRSEDSFLKKIGNEILSEGESIVESVNIFLDIIKHIDTTKRLINKISGSENPLVKYLSS
jgi:hypothetical protein